MYPAIVPEKLSGKEVLSTDNGEKISTLVDFWRWAHSDLLGNAERGVLAEYIVACALGIRDSVRISWDKYDLLTEDGISIEVKTSGYLQTWDQKKLSKPVFGINPTYGWDSTRNEYDKTRKRQADIYVFCLHKHTEQETLNPLLLEQWDFYIMSTALINEKFRGQKSVSLQVLVKAGAELCKYNDLHTRIRELVQK